ncbi:MAG: hypothetical protein V1719_00870 [Patescibacteria group bacterium]
MWWIYLVGAITMFVAMFVLMALNSSDWIITLIAGIWLLSSTRLAYREDQKPKI